ncbi:MAG: DUF721 domain-containing protein [Alphaproteobacteria bacterium]|nr:DUF721 domain-containing protein [Alphaproteobacteria bacterium]
MTKPDKTQPNKPRSETRRPGLRALAHAVPGVTAAAQVKRGFARAALIGHWTDVVGAALARGSLPEQLVFPRGERANGTLYIRVDGPLALELQHLEPLVVERINGFFGYRAVGRLALRQGPLPRPKKRPLVPPPRKLSPGEEAQLAARVAAVADPALRAALENLGRSILATQRKSAVSPPPTPSPKKP